MIKTTVTSVDLDGKEFSKDYWFNLNKAELTRMTLENSKLDDDLNLVEGGGFEGLINKIIAAKDPSLIIQTFEDILRRSYGVRHADNVTFMKSDELSENFTHTDAYSELFSRLVTDAAFAAEFMRGIIQENVHKLSEDPVPAPIPLSQTTTKSSSIDQDEVIKKAKEAYQRVLDESASK